MVRGGKGKVKKGDRKVKVEVKLNKFTKLNKNNNNNDKNNKDKGVNIVKTKLVNRQCLSADGFSLLPSALRPCLFCSSVLLLATFSLMSSLFIFGNSTFATDPFLNVTIANSISLDLKPISTTGTFAKSDTTSNTISATTNYFAGYILGIAASSNEIDAGNLLQTIVNNPGEVNEESITYRISSIGTVEGVTSTGITEQVFSSSSNTEYNNTWGYMLTKLNTSESTNYLPPPTTTTPITLDATDTANPETVNNYNIAIGARVNTETPKGSYTNTFVITAVANPIPYEITFNKGNAESGVSNLPAKLDNNTINTSITLPTTKPTRSGYVFSGWCSAMPVASGGIDSCSGDIYYQDGTGSRTFPISQVSDNTNITLYAMWKEVHTITFTAGSNIDTLIIADSSNKWWPYYVTTGGTKTFSNVPVGRKYVVTVVPVANYILDSWTSTSGSTANLADPTLLTTTYTVGTTNETLTATGVMADYTDPTKSYTAMKDFTLSNCTATGSNVTDERDGKSYTVAKFGDYCYMLSNLRLDNTTDGATPRKLTSADSDITPNATYAEFTMPTEAWTSTDQNYYCKAIMKVAGGEYYYNWYAAKANPYECADPTTDTNATQANDNLAIGSICTKNSTLPTYKDITTAMLWNSGSNLGMLIKTGGLKSGSGGPGGSQGAWWSRSRYFNGYASYMNFYGYDRGASRGESMQDGKCNGLSVRCLRSS